MYSDCKRKKFNERNRKFHINFRLIGEASDTTLEKERRALFFFFEEPQNISSEDKLITIKKLATAKRDD